MSLARLERLFEQLQIEQASLAHLHPLRSASARLGVQAVLERIYFTRTGNNDHVTREFIALFLVYTTEMFLRKDCPMPFSASGQRSCGAERSIARLGSAVTIFPHDRIIVGSVQGTAVPSSETSHLSRIDHAAFASFCYSALYISLPIQPKARS